MAHDDFYNDTRWTIAQAAAKHRDGYQCRFLLPSGARCPARTNLHAHHVRPLEMGGAPFDLSNLVTVCRRHHPTLEASARQGALGDYPSRPAPPSPRPAPSLLDALAGWYARQSASPPAPPVAPGPAPSLAVEAILRQLGRSRH